MPDKKKVKWYDTFNPFAHKEAMDKAAEPKKRPKIKTTPINWEKRIREQEAAKAAAKSPYQGTPTDPGMDRPKNTKAKKVKVVKPRKAR